MIEAVPDRCVLGNPVFARFNDALFRRAEADGMPVMVITLGEGQAALPLRALQREFHIEDDSEDGRMLGLIAESLDYVTCLRPGDKLPAEVLTGEASWTPEPRHRRLAGARLRLRLLAWLEPSAAPGSGAPARLESDPALRAQVQRAFEEAAKTLGLPDAEAVLQVVEGLAEELAYIEALREGLLGRVQAMCARLETLGVGWRGNAERQTTLTQVRRLAQIARTQLAARFAEVDAQTAEILGALRNAESQRAFIRSSRDWLYRSRRAWEPLLADWDAAGTGLDDAAWLRLGRSYQFLAPRFMPVQEWEVASSLRQKGRAGLFGPIMQW
jgi:hypothetical protein